MLTYPQWKFRRRLLGAAGIFAACLVAVVAFKALAQVAGSRTVPIIWQLTSDGGGQSWLPVSDVDAGGLASVPVAFSTTNGTQGSAYCYSKVVPVAGSIANGYLCLLQGLGPGQTSDAGCTILDGGVGPFVLISSQTPAPAFQLSYTPGANDDGGYIVSNCHTAN